MIIIIFIKNQKILKNKSPNHIFKNLQNFQMYYFYNFNKESSIFKNF